MDRNDRKAIEDLFAKLAQVARASPPRDADSEAFIREQIAAQPGAPYYMAQTIVVQEQALAAAEKRIDELERRAVRVPSGAVPSVGRQPEPAEQRAGGGFLAGAAQTALGVAGGWLLGNTVAGMFGSDKAHAAEGSGAKPEAGHDSKEQEEEEEPEAEAEEHDQEDDDGDYDTFDDDGGDFGDFDA
jgi:hypothetical protein